MDTRGGVAVKSYDELAEEYLSTGGLTSDDYARYLAERRRRYVEAQRKKRR
jgi:hypothetical protein